MLLIIGDAPVASAFVGSIDVDHTKAGYAVITDPAIDISLGDAFLIGDTMAWTNSAAHYDNCT